MLMNVHCSLLNSVKQTVDGDLCTVRVSDQETWASDAINPPILLMSCDDWYNASNSGFSLFFGGLVSDPFLQSLLLILIFITAAVTVRKDDIGSWLKPNVSANALWRVVSSKWSWSRWTPLLRQIASFSNWKSMAGNQALFVPFPFEWKTTLHLTNLSTCTLTIINFFEHV